MVHGRCQHTAELLVQIVLTSPALNTLNNSFTCLCQAPLVAANTKALVHEGACEGLACQLVACKPEGRAEQRKQDAAAGNGRKGPAGRYTRSCTQV